MTQTIDTKAVKHVAHLVRLGISEEEAQKFSGQFSSIIDYFNMLNEVDTENVPPASDIRHHGQQKCPARRRSQTLHEP